MKYIVFLITTFLYLSGDTTMCYKNNWNDPSSIELENLDGGECKGEKSIVSMKKDGWIVSDIKISTTDNGMNFIYILKKEKDNKNVEKNVDYKKLATTVENEKKKNEEQIKFDAGKKLYIKTCQRCHGEFGEKEAFNTSRPLKTLSFEDMGNSISGYKSDQMEDFDRGNAIVMKPYANMVTEDELEGIKAYLTSINK